MQGLGNDFVVIDNINGRIKLSEEQIVFLCDRHKGIGADGVILVEESEKADCFMNYYNRDGSRAEMCGNGIRCVAKFLKDEIKIIPEKINFKIETRNGIKEVSYQDDGTFSVNMGKPVFLHKDFPENSLEIEKIKLEFVSVGNPHAVAFVKNLNEHDILVLGPKIENNKNFPNKINLELVEKISANELKIKVWERGCGATLSCGTGACAVYAIAQKHFNFDKDLAISLPGGVLFLSQNEENDIIMRGEATSVFSSMIEIK